MDDAKEDIQKLGALLNKVVAKLGQLSRRLQRVETIMEQVGSEMPPMPDAPTNFIFTPHPDMHSATPDPPAETPTEEFDLRGMSSTLFFHRMCQRLENTYEDDEAFTEAQRCIQASKHFHRAWNLFKEEDL